ncbi:MAG: hypothetical protein WBG11_11510 [Methylocella sp.]
MAVPDGSGASFPWFAEWAGLKERIGGVFRRGDPIGACQRQGGNIDAGEAAPPIRSRGQNGGLCGPETWAWDHEE